MKKTKITKRELEDKIIFEAVKIGYKKGFLDGMNFDDVAMGEEPEITEEEFNKMALSQAIEKEAEKVWEKYNKEFNN